MCIISKMLQILMEPLLYLLVCFLMQSVKEPSQPNSLNC